MIDNGKTKYLITVDVESHYGHGKLLPYEKTIYGRIDGAEYGVGRIMELCDKYNVKATFFVDVYEHYKFGKQVMRDLCRYIHDAGHSVQLHAHANFIPTCKKGGSIRYYDYKTQSEILREGKELIAEWIGEAPVAFRGGAYGVNMDTVRALKENGFTIDSSYFAYYKNCALSDSLQNIYKNKLFMINDILEVPITVYDLIDLYFWKKKSKIDINACSLFELKSIIKKIMRSTREHNIGLDSIVIFLHSFSFIKWDSTFSRAYADVKTVEKFDSLLQLIMERYEDSASFIKIDEIDDEFIESIKNKALADYVPMANILHLIPRCMKHVTFF